MFLTDDRTMQPSVQHLNVVNKFVFVRLASCLDWRNITKCSWPEWFIQSPRIHAWKRCTLQNVQFCYCSYPVLNWRPVRSLFPNYIDTDSRVCWEVSRRLVVRCLLCQWSTEERGTFTQTHMPGCRWILSLMGAKWEIPHELQHDSPIPC